MIEYYFVRNNDRVGPVSFDELKKEEIKPDTLIWFNGLDKWMMAKNIPVLASLIKENRKVPIEEKPQIKQVSLYSIILKIVVGLFLIVLIIALFDQNTSSNIRDEENIEEENDFPETLSNYQVKEILLDYYNTQDSKNISKYLNYYEYPIMNYYGNIEYLRSDLSKSLDIGWNKLEYHNNYPKFDDIYINKIDERYFVKYKLKYAYKLYKDDFDIIKEFDVDVRLNKEGKIYYIKTDLISSTEKKKLSYYARFVGQNPKTTILKDSNIDSRLLAMMGSYQHRKLKNNWQNTSKIIEYEDEIYFYGCKSADCKNTNFIIVLDIKNDVLHSATKLGSYTNIFSEDESKNETIDYWYNYNDDMFGY